MKKTTWIAILLSFSFLSFLACKSKGSEASSTDTTVTSPADNTIQKAPDTSVVISSDDTLKGSLIDAVKDFSGVSATTNDGVVTLTGDITRDKLPKLMMSVNALHPKKVINNLTIK